MRTAGMLCLVALVAFAPSAHAETSVYPSSLAQAPALTLDMPAGTAPVILPDGVGAAYANAAKKRVWRTSVSALNRDHLRVDDTPNNAYDDNGAPLTLATYALSDAQGERQSWFASVRAVAYDSPLTRVELLVGQDANGDGLPQADEELCRAGQDLSDTQYCLLDLRGNTGRPLWAFAHVIGGDAAEVNVYIDTANFRLRDNGRKISVESSDDIVATPGNGSEPSRLDFSYRPDPMYGAESAFQDVGGLLLTGNDEALATATVWPVRLDVTPFVHTGKPYALAAREDLYEELKLELKPGEALNGLYLDDPGLNTIDLVMIGNASVTGWLEPLPASSVDSRPTFVDPPAAPAFHLAAAPSGAAHSLKDCENCMGTWLPVGRSRIRLAVRNMDMSNPVTARMRVRLAGPEFGGEWHGLEYSPTGNYFNPLRSGEGVFFDRVGFLQVFYWYTFEKNGNPVWYTAAVGKNAGARGSTFAPLYRITLDWTGHTIATAVGRIVLTQVDRKTLIFSWTIDGDNGSNRMVFAFEPRCTQQAPSQDYNLSGHWFDPSQPGPGTNLLGLRHGIAEGLYLFDAAGAPRWVFGSLDANGSAWGGPLYQFKGACPTCTYVAPTLTTVGNVNLQFASDTDGTGSYDVTLAPPLSGHFQWHPTLHRATDAATCSAQE